MIESAAHVCWYKMPNWAFVNNKFDYLSRRKRRNYNNKRILWWRARCVPWCVLRLPLKYGRQCDLARRPIENLQIEVCCVFFICSFFSRSSSFVHRIKWINNGPLDAQNHSTQYYLRLALAQNNQPTATTQWHTLSVVIFIWLIQSILAWKPNWHTMISKALYQRPSGNLDRDPTLKSADSESFANEFKTLTAKQFWLIWDKDQPLWFLSNRNDRLRNSFEQSWKWTTKMASNL